MVPNEPLDPRTRAFFPFARGSRMKEGVETEPSMKLSVSIFSWRTLTQQWLRYTKAARAGLSVEVPEMHEVNGADVNHRQPREAIFHCGPAGLWPEK